MTCKCDDEAPLKLEVGKFYRTRGGEKRGPMRLAKSKTYPFTYPFTDGNISWAEDGSYICGKTSEHDIVAEWADEPAQPSPVRTVTRKEIIPGVYGHVSVLRSNGVWLALSKDEHVAHAHLTPTELRAAIKTLTEIADAME